MRNFYWSNLKEDLQEGKYNRLVGVRMTKANNLKRKTLLSQVRGWYVLIYISLRLIQIFKFLVIE